MDLSGLEREVDAAQDLGVVDGCVETVDDEEGFGHPVEVTPIRLGEAQPCVRCSRVAPVTTPGRR
jgi:hypothetical protein